MIQNPKPMHPGQVLEEVYMSQMKMNQSDLAKRLKCAPRKVNEIINGKRGISPEFALCLEKEIGTSAAMWVRMQAEWDLFQARLRAA